MNPDMIQLYRRMLRIRRVEERIADLYPRQQMRCPVHLSIGQEAVAVGVCSVLQPNDYVLSGHRSHSHYLAKGGDLKKMMAELYGKVGGCSKGKGGSMHLVDLDAGFLGATPIVGSTIGIATGAALGVAMKTEARVIVIFFGEGATEEGIFFEAVNFAALKRLPIIFVCENNLYSVYSPMSVRQPAERDNVTIVRGLGVPGVKGDGNDVEVVFRLAREAIELARAGNGPSYLEFATYRWREHCGPNYDNDIGYRTEQEFLQWKKQCPLARTGAVLRNAGLLSDVLETGMNRDLVREIDEAVVFAESSPFPPDTHLEQDVYG